MPLYLLYLISFVLETDACDKGIGVVLIQAGHLIVFLSRAPKNQGLATYAKECLVILYIDH
jgi:hypothetical protein